MAVSRNALLLFIFIFSPSVIADTDNEEINQAEILDDVNIAFTKATKLLDDSLIFCEELRQTTPIPILNKNYLSSINATREDILIGLFHLNFRNKVKCEGDLRIKLAYAIGSLISIRDTYNLDSKSLNDANLGFMYPPTNEIKMKLRYFKLPEKLKIYLEKTIGDKPFKIIEAVENNDLSATQK